MYYVYILYSEKLDKSYIGSSADIEFRLWQHNNKKVKFTSRGIPWVLKYQESFADRNSAMKREYQIKSKKSRKYIEWLIAG
jgi:putative endonuclease